MWLFNKKINTQEQDGLTPLMFEVSAEGTTPVPIVETGSPSGSETRVPSSAPGAIEQGLLNLSQQSVDTGNPPAENVLQEFANLPPAIDQVSLQTSEERLQQLKNTAAVNGEDITSAVRIANEQFKNEQNFILNDPRVAEVLAYQDALKTQGVESGVVAQQTSKEWDRVVKGFLDEGKGDQLTLMAAHVPEVKSAVERAQNARKVLEANNIVGALKDNEDYKAFTAVTSKAEADGGIDYDTLQAAMKVARDKGLSDEQLNAEFLLKGIKVDNASRTVTVNRSRKENEGEAGVASKNDTTSNTGGNSQEAEENDEQADNNSEDEARKDVKLSAEDLNNALRPVIDQAVRSLGLEGEQAAVITKAMNESVVKGVIEQLKGKEKNNNIGLLAALVLILIVGGADAIAKGMGKVVK